MVLVPYEMRQKIMANKTIVMMINYIDLETVRTVMTKYEHYIMTSASHTRAGVVVAMSRSVSVMILMQTSNHPTQVVDMM